MVFGFLNNPLGDDMIGVLFETSLFSRELFKMPFCRFGPTFLKALTKGGHALSVLLDSFATKDFTFRVGSQIDNSKINAQSPTFWLVWFRRGSFESHRKIKGAIAIEQVC